MSKNIRQMLQDNVVMHLLPDDTARGTFFDDVGRFHEKFKLPVSGDMPPRQLPPDLFRFRMKFMLEELAEFAQSQGAMEVMSVLHTAIETTDRSIVPAGDRTETLADAGDALVDLVYVALGTAHLMHLPLNEMWAGVQHANMAKERAISKTDKRSKRQHAFDVVKPEGWKPPDHWPILFRRIASFIKKEKTS